MTDTTYCYHCGSNKINKAGLTKNKKQRYYCRSCRRFSRENPVIKKDNENKTKTRTKALPSKSHLVLQLQAIAQRLGKTPTTIDIAELSKKGRAFPLHVYYEVFDSFTGAIKKSRLKPRYNQEFDKDKLIDELHALRRKLKRALIAKDVAKARKRGEVSSIHHFQRAFGSVPNAITEAGAARREFTRAEIITYLKTLRQQLNRVPTGELIDEKVK